MKKFTILILFLVLTALFILPTTNYKLQTAYAQTCSVQNSYPRVKDGLISTPDISGSDNFRSNIGKCVFDPGKTAFAPYKIPSYADLKSLYYTQAKTTTTVTKHTPLVGNKTQVDIPMNGSTDHLWYISKSSPPTSSDGNLTITNNIPGNQTGVVFVDGNLTINPTSKKLTIANSSGLVFVVQGNVNIGKDVTQIDAVIISSGKIHTAGSSCSTNAEEVDNALTINGSLISLDAGEPIQFCRKLKGSGNDTNPAEIINFDPKYLVILRNLFADTLQKWSEIQ